MIVFYYYEMKLCIEGKKNTDILYLLSVAISGLHKAQCGKESV